MNETTEQIKDVTDEELVELRAEVNRISREEGMSISAMARESSIPNGTFSSWLAGTYAGRNERIGGQVKKWLVARAERRATQSQQPQAPGFIETPSALKHFAMFAHAQYAPDFCLETGVPGIGKTVSAREYQLKTPHVFLITAQPAMTTVPGLLLEIAEAVNVDYSSSTQRLAQRIIRRLRNTQSLLMVDEAQHLSVQQIEQLRTIHDLADIGVVLIGNLIVLSRIDGAGRTSNYAQLFSRVGQRRHRSKVTKGDVDLLLNAWGIEGADVRKFTAAIAAKSGALRLMTKVLRRAVMAARIDDPDGQLTVAHVKASYAVLSSGDVIEEAA